MILIDVQYLTVLRYIRKDVLIKIYSVKQPDLYYFEAIKIASSA